MFVWYDGDEDDDPKDPDLARGAVTHAGDCADAFGEKLAARADE